MAFSLRYFFFGQLPLYYKVNDTYKDVDDRGLLERYLEIFGKEVDDEIFPKIENYLDIIIPLETPEQYLTALGFTLGSPPDLLNDPNLYAKVLAYIIQIYKIKGTARAFELLFQLLGYSITVVELPPSETVLLDSLNILDDGLTFDAGCPGCSGYEIIINTLLNPGEGDCDEQSHEAVDNTILATFIKIIEFNQPINADLMGLVNGGLVCEKLNLCVNNEVTYKVIAPLTLDGHHQFDFSLLVDDGEIINTKTAENGCNPKK